MTPDAMVRWRKRMKWTQDEAAEALGLSKSAVQKYEKGTREIPLAVRLACLALIALGVRDYAGPADEDKAA